MQASSVFLLLAAVFLAPHLDWATARWLAAPLAVFSIVLVFLGL